MKRVHIRSAVNAANVSKAGDLFTVRDVCGAVDNIVMNRVMYPGDQLAAAVNTLEGKPAPAGHPKNGAGQYISALSGDGLLNAYMGAICRNARHEGGRTLVDIVVNAKAASAHPDGAKLVERLEAAINGSNVDPIHVSTGLMLEPVAQNGESGGKPYEFIATNMNYDHLAVLLHERGAGTPAEGVGMWLNTEGQAEPVDEVTVNVEPEDKRAKGFKAWALRLVGNGSADMSFEQISDGLYKGLAEGAWLREVFDRYAVWTDRDGRMFKQDYAVSSDGSVAWSGTAEEVRREVTYKAINHLKGDPMKEQIVAALNKAGIQTAGKTDEQMLQDFTALSVAPLQEKLTAANSKLAEIEQAAKAAADAELAALAAELATNSALKADDFKAMGLARCRELKAAGKPAAPVLAGNAGGAPAKSAYADYDPNEHFTTKEAA